MPLLLRVWGDVASAIFVGVFLALDIAGVATTNGDREVDWRVFALFAFLVSVSLVGWRVYRLMQELQEPIKHVTVEAFPPNGDSDQVSLRRRRGRLHGVQISVDIYSISHGSPTVMTKVRLQLHGRRWGLIPVREILTPTWWDMDTDWTKKHPNDPERVDIHLKTGQKDSRHAFFIALDRYAEGRGPRIGKRATLKIVTEFGKPDLRISTTIGSYPVVDR